MDDTIPHLQKQCTKCKEWFPATLEFFHVSKQSPSGLKVYCKACRSAMSKEARRKNHPREILPDGYKRCSDCKEIKPATTEHFRPDPRYTYGVASRCKICTRAYQRQRNAKRRPTQEEILPGFRRCTICKELLPATTEYFNKKQSGLNAKCKICDRASQVQYRILHRSPTYIPVHQRPIPTEKACSKCGIVKPATTTYFSPKKRARTKVSSWCRECDKRYHLAHIEQSLARSRTRRARKKALPGTHTAQDIQNQLKRQKGKCYYCGQKLTKYHVDHVIPIARGGSNDPSNLVIACPFCNDSKGNKLPHEWVKGGRLL